MAEVGPMREVNGSRGETGRSRQQDDTMKERQDSTPVALYTESPATGRILTHR